MKQLNLITISGIILIIILILSLLFLFSGCNDEEYKYISIFFDDGCENNYTRALPVLLKYNFKASFGIVTDFIGKGENESKGMTLDQIKDLSKLGMDIASHSCTHQDLTNFNENKHVIYDEIFNSKKILESYGFDIRTFVYPFTRCDDEVVEFVKEAGYICARIGWSEKQTWNPGSLTENSNFLIPSFDVSLLDRDNFRNVVSRAGKNAVVSLTYHGIQEVANRDDFSVSLDDFSYQMNYLKENKYKVILVPDMVESVNNKESKYKMWIPHVLE